VLRVVATVAFAKAQVLPILPGFYERHPEVHLSLELTYRPIDLAAEGIDVAIRFTEQIDDGSVIARRLASNRRVICAAPAYLERFGVPEHASDLARRNCLCLSTVTRWNDWHLDEPAGNGPILLKGNSEANSADGIYHATLAWLEMTSMPAGWCACCRSILTKGPTSSPSTPRSATWRRRSASSSTTWWNTSAPSRHGSAKLVLTNSRFRRERLSQRFGSRLRSNCQSDRVSATRRSLADSTKIALV
jgi:DNA-binding transcriptional LysR family regulator